MDRARPKRSTEDSSTAPPPSGLCECGCGGTTQPAKTTSRVQGRVQGEPLRFLPGHQRKHRHRYAEEPRGYETACWIWQLCKGENGYGRVNDCGKNRYAHRIAYEQANGPVPDGRELDHLCGNRDCVNPDHLEPVTHAENMRRGSRTKLTLDQALAIKRSSEPQRVLAERFGIGQGQVSRIQKGLSWRDLDASAA